MVSLTSVEYFGDWPNRWLHNLHRRYSTDFCYIFSERIYLTWCDWRRRENRRLLLFTMFTYLLTVHLGAQSWQVYAEGSEPSIEVLPGSVDDSERIHGMDYDQVNGWCTEVPLCTHSAKAWIRRAGDKVEQMTCRRKSWKLFIYLHVYKYLNIYFLSLFFFSSQEHSTSGYSENKRRLCRSNVFRRWPGKPECPTTWSSHVSIRWRVTKWRIWRNSTQMKLWTIALSEHPQWLLTLKVERKCSSDKIACFFWPTKQENNGWVLSQMRTNFKKLAFILKHSQNQLILTTERVHVSILFL